ncbi:hypothetical protein GGS20DRAFT_333284 [Poronia punctata]|nr:hypothetical protein GGS20DRAFT_333284 [Poronia punctata]
MCQGIQTTYSCLHKTWRINSLCPNGYKFDSCHNPTGPSTKSPEACSRCDPIPDPTKEYMRREARKEELMRHFMGHTTTTTTTSSSSSTASSFLSTLADDDDDDENDEMITYKLNQDGKTVLRKEYKIINDHYNLITTRLDVKDVDPGIVAKLHRREAREAAMKRMRRRRMRLAKTDDVLDEREKQLDREWMAFEQENDDDLLKAGSTPPSATTKPIQKLSSHEKEKESEEKESADDIDIPVHQHRVLRRSKKGAHVTRFAHAEYAREKKAEEESTRLKGKGKGKVDDSSSRSRHGDSDLSSDADPEVWDQFWNEC